MEDTMKSLTFAIVGLTLVMIGALHVRSASMESNMGKTDEMATSQSMKHDDMGMKTGDMPMKHEEMKIKTDQTMIPSDVELRRRLTPLQYKVTRQDGTEPAFANTYWDNHEPGIYVDIISGAPLFSSTDKYDSGTGWPSFTRPLDPAQIVEKEDRSFFSVRTEVRGKLSDAHLGHVFDDGPPPTGLRYCMNSAALRFIPQADLAKEGYGEYVKLFK
jgi:methionine-R-sulfoxide reductase